MSGEQKTPVEISPGITVDPTVRFGKPVIKGTRVPVNVVVAALASSLDAAEVAEEYGITEKGVQAALHYAARRLAEEEVRATA